MLIKKNIPLSYKLLITLIISVLFFIFLYQRDNKYTHSALQPINGILSLTNEDLNNHPLRFLTHQWEYYPKVLLSPGDFKAGSPDTYKQYLMIGQYGGLETGNKNRSPHGSATYHLTLDLPSPQRTYAIELPEIYSAYKLYINDTLIAQVGDPSPENYKARIQNRVYTFSAKGQVSILLAVTDYSYFYSGLIYPPAFGEPLYVNTLRGIRLFIRGFAFFLSVSLFFLSIYLGSKEKKKRILLFCGITLCLIGYTGYTFLHTFFETSVQPWYSIERFCFFAMCLFIVMLINDLCQVNNTIKKVSTYIGFIFCTLTLCLGIFMPLFNLTVLESCALLFSIFKWLTALYILVTVAFALHNRTFQNETLLCGIVFYGISLLADRLLPLYEPIYTGWFPEWGGGVLIFLLSCILWKDVIDAYQLQIIFKEECHQMERQIDMQKRHYIQLMEKIEETKKVRHDLRHNMRIIGTLFHEQKWTELSNYLNQYENQPILQSEPYTICHNFAADAVIRYYKEKAALAEINFNVSVCLPSKLSLSDTEICIILSNLLENAFEACLYNTSLKDPSIRLLADCADENLSLTIENSFSGVLQNKHGLFLSTKHNGSGIGIASVQTIVKRHDGLYSFQKINNCFCVSILIPLKEAHSI